MEVVKPEQMSYTFKLRLAKNFGIPFVSTSINLLSSQRKSVLKLLLPSTMAYKGNEPHMKPCRKTF